MRGHKPGQTGGHVGFVGSQGSLGNGRFQFFGANTTAEYTDTEARYIFRRPHYQGQAAGGGADPGNDLSRSAYDRMFSGTKLAGQYDNVVRAARANGVPPSLMAGIMAHETGRGTSQMLQDKNNPAGLMDPATGARTGQSFPTVEAGIDEAGRRIGNNYRKGGGTIQGMAGIYAPPGAANDPGNKNIGWPAGVSSYQQQLRDGTSQAPAAAQTPAAAPGAKLAPSGNAPVAMVIHHTGPAGSVRGIVEDWRTNRPGVGTQYIVDRNGVIHDVEKEFGYRGSGHILPSATLQKYKDMGIKNENIVGIEVMAKDDKDVTPLQRRVVEQFIRKNYPNTPVYGHGELVTNREPEEGRTIVTDIRRERAGGGAYGGVPPEDQQPQQRKITPSTAPPPPKLEEKSTPYSQWYFQNKVPKKDVPIERKAEINNTSDYDVTLDRMVPSDL
jgi:hypothetical protein